MTTIALRFDFAGQAEKAVRLFGSGGPLAEPLLLEGGEQGGGSQEGGGWGCRGGGSVGEAGCRVGGRGRLEKVHVNAGATPHPSGPAGEGAAGG